LLNEPVTSLALDPADSNVIYASGGFAGGSVLTTGDGGNSWSLLGDLAVAGLNTGVTSIRFDTSTEILYAATSNGVWEYGPTLVPPSAVQDNRHPREVEPRP